MKHEKREAIQQEESLSPDIVAFCSLMARIMLRCLRQHDTRLERFLFLPEQTEKQQRGGTYDPTLISSISSLTSGALPQELPAQTTGRDRRALGAGRPLYALSPMNYVRRSSFMQAAPGRCRSKAAQGGIRLHAQPLRGACR